MREDGAQLGFVSGPMPVVQKGSHGQVVHSLQSVLHNGASEWGTAFGPIDGQFGSQTHKQ